LVKSVVHAPPKLEGWVRFPVGLYQRHEKRHLRPFPGLCSALMGGCKETVKSRCCRWLAVQHSLRPRGPLRKRKCVPQATRDTLKAVLKPSINETELSHCYAQQSCVSSFEYGFTNSLVVMNTDLLYVDHILCNWIIFSVKNKIAVRR